MNLVARSVATVSKLHHRSEKTMCDEPWLDDAQRSSTLADSSPTPMDGLAGFTLIIRPPRDALRRIWWDAAFRMIAATRIISSGQGIDFPSRLNRHNQVNLLQDASRVASFWYPRRENEDLERQGGDCRWRLESESGSRP